MTITVIGATGNVGTLVARGLLAEGRRVRALVRDPGKARDRLGPDSRLEIITGVLGTPADLEAAFRGADAAYVALGSIGLEGNLARLAILAAGRAALPQLVRLSVLNTSPTSVGINQRAHWNIDFAAAAASIHYATVRPAIFSASLLAGGPVIRASRTWTGLADTGKAGPVGHRDVTDVCVRILLDPATRGQHHDLTGPELLSWPDVMRLLAAEIGEPVTFQTTSETELISRLTGTGASPGQAELLIARERALQAGENERLTGEIQRLTGHEPRTVREFLHDFRSAFAGGAIHRSSGRREPAAPAIRPGHGSRGSRRDSPETERIMTEAFTQKPSVHRPPHAPATAADVMRPAPATIEPRDHVVAAAYLMKHAGATALVVVDDEQTEQPVGIITEADIAQAVADGKDVNDVRVRTLLTTHLTVINAGTSIRDAARSMVTGHFRHLPVAGEAGLIGMADITDVCAALPGPPQDDLLASRDRRTPGRPGRDRTDRTSAQERRYA
jgi:NAD(P)H dehydrogenase (quinone)